ncbi:MAG: 3-phosphoserine/phosphohydroxythreonine transaminase [Desulfobacterales bacterium]|nr:3-phosphoserine/phosphohydroxythreonine transaminase [Desulfobacterales bacterium]
MQVKRIYNFNPGPAVLPESVLQEIQSEFMSFKGTGMSITEISHRSKAFEDVLNDAIVRIKRLLKLDDRFHVLFLQGGASLQFSMIPMNLLADGQTADYINTGTWATKAIKEAKILGKKVHVAASSEDRNFAYIPKQFQFSQDAAYVHITSNNTIKGTQWSSFPNTGNIPMISDMSSDIMSRPFNASSFGCIYAGAQKNMGPAGVCIVILREDMLKRVPTNLPSMLKYTTHTENNSLYNTPPCFSIYTVYLVMKWLEETIGGLEKMEELNQKKAGLLYDFMEKGDFYRSTADKDSRSLMNVTFRLPNEELEKKFVAEAKKNDLDGLKGHRSVGGCRASIYNAMPLAGVETLVSFMESFQKQNR